MDKNRPTIEEENIYRRSRSDWETDRLKIQGHIFKMESSVNGIDEEILRMYQDRIEYIDMVLDRYYTNMCIRCAYKTPVEVHATETHCMNCMRNIIYRVIDEMTDEERADFEERLDKQLDSKGE